MTRTKRKSRPSKRARTRRARATRGSVANGPPRARGVAPTPQRRFKRGVKKRGLRDEIFITFFKAEGGIGTKASVIYTGVKSIDFEMKNSRWRKKHLKYVEAQEQSPRGFPNAPGVWTSNEGLFLGQVNFPGRQSRRMMFKMLGVALGLVKRDGKVADFTRVYSTYSWHYKVVRMQEERYKDSSGIERIRLAKKVRTVSESSGNKN